MAAMKPRAAAVSTRAAPSAASLAGSLSRPEVMGLEGLRDHLERGPVPDAREDEQQEERGEETCERPGLGPVGEAENHPRHGEDHRPEGTEGDPGTTEPVRQPSTDGPRQGTHKRPQIRDRERDVGNCDLINRGRPEE